MNHYLVLRLTNAAIDCDRRGQGNLAALITEAINELEKSDPLKLAQTKLRKEWTES